MNNITFARQRLEEEDDKEAVSKSYSKIKSISNTKNQNANPSFIRASLNRDDQVG